MNRHKSYHTHTHTNSLCCLYCYIYIKYVVLGKTSVLALKLYGRPHIYPHIVVYIRFWVNSCKISKYSFKLRNNFSTWFPFMCSSLPSCQPLLFVLLHTWVMRAWRAAHTLNAVLLLHKSPPSSFKVKLWGLAFFFFSYVNYVWHVAFLKCLISLV